MNISLVKSLGVAFSLLLSTTVGSVSAATLTHDGAIIKLKGIVKSEDSDRLKILIEATGITAVYLESPGGVAVEAYRIGKVLRDANASVTVKEGTMCLSACAIAFLGGSTQKMGGTLGFHVAWSPSKGSYSEGLKSGQYIGSVTSTYMFKMGYTAQLMNLVAMVTDSETFLILSQEDIDMFKMVDKNYVAQVDLPKLWLYDRVADPLRMNLRRGGY